MSVVDMLIYAAIGFSIFTLILYVISSCLYPNNQESDKTLGQAR